QRPGVLAASRPVVAEKQLVVHFPELSLLAGALRGEGRVARIRVRRQREIAIAPADLALRDQLLTDHGHLDRGERGAEGALEVRVLGDLDRGGVRAQREAAAPV